MERTIVTKNLIGVALLSLLAGTAVAGPSTFVEGAFITGGENGQGGSDDEDGFEIAGAVKLTDIWYIGGALGSYDRDGADGPGNGNFENDYLNLAGGVAYGLTPKTDFIGELGVWAGQQENPGNQRDSDPYALEFKTGVNHAITDKFSVGGTISLVWGDTDSPAGSDELTNFVWSAGGAYAFTDNVSVSLKIVEGSNGVNGQSDVVRIGARWTF
jgi:hypothetical protein